MRNMASFSVQYNFEDNYEATIGYHTIIAHSASAWRVQGFPKLMSRPTSKYAASEHDNPEAVTLYFMYLQMRDGGKDCTVCFTGCVLLALECVCTRLARSGTRNSKTGMGASLIILLQTVLRIVVSYVLGRPVGSASINHLVLNKYRT